MSKNNHISPEEVFKTGLEGHEADYLPGDWEHMLNLLEEDGIPAAPLQPNTRKKKTIFNLKNILVMTILTTIAAGIMLLSDPVTETIQKASDHIQITDQLPKDSRFKPEGGEENSTSINSSILPDNTVRAGFGGGPIIPIQNQESFPTLEETNESTMGNNSGVLEQMNPGLPLEIEPPNSDEKTKPQAKELGPIDTAKFYKAVTSKYWVDSTFKYIDVKPHKDIEDGWIGVYYTSQTPDNAVLWDSAGRLTENSGFNLQFMSGNLSPGENLAIYGGFDWGMQFYGRSDKDEVIINSVNEDRGLTFMRSHVNDIFVTGQVEWAQLPIIPYVTASVGTRIFTTAQTTRALLESSEYESTTTNGLFTRAALATKIGAGARLKLAPRVHLDFRYELIRTKELDVVNYSATSFNGLDYDVGTQKMNLNASQFRFGVVFDLSYDDEDKVLDKPGYWEEQTQQLYLDPSDSSKVFVPCPCNPCDTKKKSRQSSRKNSIWEDLFDDSSPGTTPGGGWGGGKSDFPGLKIPPINH